MRKSRFQTSLTIALLVSALAVTPALADDAWTHWRGPHQTGVSPATDLITSWSKDGQNLIWRDDFTGRSTPVLVDGRVCANGRAGEGINRQEVVACWNAETGEKLWERRFNVYLTTVPWNRVGWGDLAADEETGYVYAQIVHGLLVALDAEGETAWQWELGQDLGRASGYGGRTNTPIVDEGRLLVHVIGSGFGGLAGLGDRFFAFDKKTGEVLWISPRWFPPKDLNTYSTPVVATIDGQRLMIGGGADGRIHAVQARTGKDVWSFHLSQRGLNSSVVVGGDTVYASHSEENLDAGVMGRVVAIDATGSGDVTQSHELWRVDELGAGYASPVLHEGVLHVADNSANLVALDAKTGEHLWEINYGTVGKGSPVWADGKIYVTEVNGNFVIIKPGEEGAEILDDEHLEMPSGRYAEIYASPAVGYGRIYFTTEEGIYCLGDPEKPFKAQPAKTMADSEEMATGEPAQLLIKPAVVVGNAGESHTFEALAYDAMGNFVGTVDAEWSLEGLPGKIDGSGKLSFDSAAIHGTQIGEVEAKAGELTATAHLRIAGKLPWKEDFEAIAVGEVPKSWLGTGKNAHVEEADGGKILVQPVAPRGAPRATMLIGPSYLSGYTVQADVKGNREGRRLTDLGVVNSGYLFEIQGAHQRIQVSSWASERRMAQQFPFEWEMDVWYTLKTRVDQKDGKAVVRGKVWKRGEDEPADWTVTVEDPLPIENGSPGIYAFAPVEAYFDNVLITVSE